MYCYKCGKKLEDGARFCSECGVEIEKNELEGVDPVKSNDMEPVENSESKTVNSGMHTLGILLLIGGVIAAFIVPSIAKSNHRNMGMMSAWSFTYRWGNTFYMFIAGVIITGIILMVVAQSKK